MLVQSGWGFPDGYFRISLGTSALKHTRRNSILTCFHSFHFVFSHKVPQPPVSLFSNFPRLLSPDSFLSFPPQIPEVEFWYLILHVVRMKYFVVWIQCKRWTQTPGPPSESGPGISMSGTDIHPVPGALRPEGTMCDQWGALRELLHPCSSHHPLGPDIGGPWPGWGSSLHCSPKGTSFFPPVGFWSSPVAPLVASCSGHGRLRCRSSCSSRVPCRASLQDLEHKRSCLFEDCENQDRPHHRDGHRMARARGPSCVHARDVTIGVHPICSLGWNSEKRPSLPFLLLPPFLI